eukprot:TRINITY_DN941_c0_g1_i6.p1 TRINITY_DN941_c0_g1~~TRINITY_DN941_c0_g1_i6.p1  ORF type:complete len:264 (-),score=43.30 TRINITY_DN941_c0_g1_i6:1381-2172(-)
MQLLHLIYWEQSGQPLHCLMRDHMETQIEECGEACIGVLSRAMAKNKQQYPYERVRDVWSSMGELRDLMKQWTDVMNPIFRSKPKKITPQTKEVVTVRDWLSGFIEEIRITEDWQDKYNLPDWLVYDIDVESTLRDSLKRVETVFFERNYDYGELSSLVTELLHKEPQNIPTAIVFDESYLDQEPPSLPFDDAPPQQVDFSDSSVPHSVDFEEDSSPPSVIDFVDDYIESNNNNNSQDFSEGQRTQITRSGRTVQPSKRYRQG